MAKMNDLHILLGETIDKLVKDRAEHPRKDSKGFLLTITCLTLQHMRDGLVPVDKIYLQAVRDFFQMDRRLPREETVGRTVCKNCGEKVVVDGSKEGTHHHLCPKCGPTDGVKVNHE